jgi:hypothetical protein
MATFRLQFRVATERRGVVSQTCRAARFIGAAELYAAIFVKKLNKK